MEIVGGSITVSVIGHLKGRILVDLASYLLLHLWSRHLKHAHQLQLHGRERLLLFLCQR